MELRKGTKGVEEALAAQLNALRDALVGTNVHAQVTPSRPAAFDATLAVAALAIGEAAPTTGPTRFALANGIRRVLNTHYGDMSAHKSVQSVAVTTETATDEATAITLANACKASFNTGGHINAANVHHNADGTNAIAAVDATNTATLDALLTELKSDINAHILLGLAGQHVVLVAA